MQTQEIPRAEWLRFFDSFSRQHEGWRATLELLSADIGAQHQAEDLSFQGISMNSDDSDRESIVISLVQSADDHVTHMIDHPTHVWLQQTDEGADAALEVLREDPLGREAQIIGKVEAKRDGICELRTNIGGRRILQKPYGEQLPRIC